MGLLKKMLILSFSMAVFFISKANGKNDGIVKGQVTDATTKKPIAGVTVSMVGSNLNNEREVTTDPDGNFKISRLPAGEFTLLFEKKGYKLHKRELINTKAGMVYKITLDMVKEEAIGGDSYDFTQPLLRMSGGI